MSITEAPAVLTARCSKSWSRASGSTPTTIWFSSVRQASAKVGWPQRLATKPVATIGRSSISGRPVCSRISRWPAATGAIPASYATSAEPTFSSSTIWGLEPLDAAARHDLLEILEERYGRRSSVITSQLPIDRWHEIIGDPTYADAILDRLIHNAHRIELAGESLRRTQAKQSRKA
jgi:IstB-like ATP binding protein